MATSARTKYIALAIVLIIIIVGAIYAYNYLAAPGPTTTTTTLVTTTTQAATTTTRTTTTTTVPGTTTTTMAGTTTTTMAGTTTTLAGLTLNSGNIAFAGSWSFTFTQAGTYNYHCSNHAQMTGKVIVQDVNATTAPGNKSVSIWGTPPKYYDPPTLYVLTGTKVTWMNMDAAGPHTVTS